MHLNNHSNVIAMLMVSCYDVSSGIVMSCARYMGLVACAFVAIGLSYDQGFTVTYPLLWQQQENTSQVT